MAEPNPPARTVAIIQARTGSTRLPDKVLTPLLGRAMLQQVVERTQRATTLDAVAIATTTAARDDRVVALAEQLQTPCFRGSEDDVLDRYYQTARQLHATVIVRITADCPCIDPQLIDAVVTARHTTGADYCSNVLERRLPRGLDTEVFTMAALTTMWRDATDPGAREHVTAYITQHPAQFRCHAVVSSHDWSHLRWTVDTAEDLAVVTAIFDHFGQNHFTWQDTLAYCQSHPNIVSRNAHIRQKTV